MTSPPAPKRKDRPCDACRKRKSRCVLENDSIICVLCKFHNQECTFVHSPQIRKRKILQDGDEVEDAKRRQSSTLSVTKRSPGAQKRIIRTTYGTGVEEYDDLEGPSLLKKTLGLQNKHHSQYLGATRGLEPSLLGRLSEKSEVQLTGGTLRRVSSREAFLLLPDPGTQGYEDELDDLDKIEAIVKPHGKTLVAMYFRIVFPSFPILHKEVYLEKYGRSYREFSPPLLAAVYLLALQYWSYNDQLKDQTKPDVLALERLGRKALGDTIHRPKLSTVQAGLLLLQYTDIDTAELTAQLTSVAYGLGLHLDASQWNIPTWEKGLRKRLGWALYMQDKWSSLGSGRPALINSDNWALEPVNDDDFPETVEDDQEGSSEVQKGRVLFSHLISLSQILANLLETVFIVRATREIANAGMHGLSIVLEKVKPVQLRLKEWFSNLPDCLSLETTDVMKLNSVGYLRLAYVATEISLHRRILLSLTPATDPQLYRICRSVAHERFMFAIDFVHSLKPQHLCSFWYFASPQNFALISVFGTLLLSTVSSPEEAKFYRSKLREYRWTLKINSENGARYMKPAMALLDANLGLLEEATTSQESASNVPENHTLEDGSNASESTDNTNFASSHLSSAKGFEDFASPSQYSFDAPYYPELQSADTSPVAYTAGSSGAQTHDFGFEGTSNGGWSY